MSNYRWLTFYLLILFALAACRPASSPPVPQATPTAVPPTPTPEANLVEVTRVVTEQLEPTATPAPCTPLPEGMRLTISMAEEARTILLDTEGLLPEDVPAFRLNGYSANHSSELVLTLANPVGPTGRLQEKFYLGDNDNEIIEWSGQVIHQRGAICFEFTLPLTEPLVLEGTAVANPTASATPIPSPTPIPTSEAVAGWLAYHNDFFNYTISYPPEARISVRGFSGFPTEELPAGLTVEEYAQQLEAIYPDDICVSLAYSGGFVTILPPAEAGGKYGRPCGVTGVGDYDIVDVSETVTIDGTTYTAEGWQVRLRDEAATWHNEFYFIWLNDDTLIQFGSTLGTEEQFLAVKDTLLQIVSSYQSTGLPKSVRLLASGATLFFIRDADLWRAQPDGTGLEQLTIGGLFRRDPTDDNIVFLHDPVVSPDGRFITYSNEFGTLNLVDVTGAQPVQTLNSNNDAVAWAAHSHLLAYVYQSKIRLLHVTTGESETLPNQGVAGVGNLIFSPYGRFLAYSCCFTSGGDDDSVNSGEIRVIELLNGSETAVGETWSSIGGGTLALCWTADNEVMTVDDERLENRVSCSQQNSGGSAVSPDGTQLALLSLLNPNDDVYFRRLIVKDSITDETIWQRDFDVILRRVSWSADGQQLFLHVAEEQWWPNNGTSDDAIYTLPADGSGELELVLENAVLLDVIPAWGN